MYLPLLRRWGQVYGACYKLGPPLIAKLTFNLAVGFMEDIVASTDNGVRNQLITGGPHLKIFMPTCSFRIFMPTFSMAIPSRIH